MEVAGVVLGSLPLLIAALEHHEDVARPTKEFFEWKKHRIRLRKELYILRTSFDEGVKILLRDANFAEPEEMIEMLDNPNSSLWAFGPIADELRGALGPTYDPFILTIVEISEILTSIMRHLNIEGAQSGNGGLRDIVLANPPVASSAHLKRNFKLVEQVAFTMKKKAIKSNLRRVEECSGRIDTWIARVQKGQSNGTVHHTKPISATLQTLRVNASKLHRILSRSWCKTRAHHSAFLLLEQRLQRPRRNHGTQGMQIPAFQPDANHFRVSIRGACFQHSSQLNTEIRMGDSLASFRTSPNKLATSAQPRRVGFNVAAVRKVEPEPPYNDPLSLPQIAEFCHYMQRPVHTHTGFCLDHQGELRAYSLEKTSVQYINHHTTLEQVLPDMQEKLPLEQLYGLAMALVASIFQLSHTPWLENEWSKKDIAFLRESGDPPPTVDIKFPYLIQTFPKKQGMGNVEPSDCSKFLALAIMLLEINFGKPIEQMHRPEDQGGNTKNDESVDLMTANRWFKAKRSRLTSGFQDVILASLQEYLNPGADLSNPAYCEVIKEKMFQPLEKDMRILLR